MRGRIDNNRFARMHDPQIAKRRIQHLKPPAQKKLFIELCMYCFKLLEFERRPFPLCQNQNVNVALKLLKCAERDRTVDVDSVDVIVQRFERAKIGIEKRLNERGNA